MALDCDSGVAVFGGKFHHPVEFRTIFVATEGVLIRLELDGEGDKCLFVQHSVFVKRLNFGAHHLFFEPLLPKLRRVIDGCREQILKDRRVKIQVRWQQRVALLGETPVDSHVQPRFIEPLKAGDGIARVIEKGDVAGLPDERAIGDEPVRVFLQRGKHVSAVDSLHHR